MSKSVMRQGLTLTLLLLLAPAVVPAQQPAKYVNPVVPYDSPDPSIIRVGQDYWAAATAGAWAPLFTILHSRDLVNWEIAGSVFEDAPAWGVDNFWAPELVEYRGRFFVYYTAQRRNGPLCVGVASSDSVTGPYTDHGPLVCQEAGSIDADMVEDRQGDLYLVWKEDGNSRGRPTVIWAQRLAADGVTLAGDRVELIRNDAPWEGGVVEGPYVLWHEGFYYLFYSGNTCCGSNCDYALGVARSASVLGPWEKYAGNPILDTNASWKCPGHGTVVEDETGRDFLLYHAYRNREDAVFVGRMALLDRVAWRADGWPEINAGRGPSKKAPAPYGIGNAKRKSAADDFAGPALDPHWKWLLFNRPSATIESGTLVLSPRAEASGDPLGAVLARPHLTPTYTAVVRLETAGMPPGAVAGVAALEWLDRAVGVAAGADGQVVVWKRARGTHQVVASAPMPGGASAVFLRLSCEGGDTFRFAFGRDGKRWTEIGGILVADFLGYQQLALTAGGAPGAFGRFDSISVKYR